MLNETHPWMRDQLRQVGSWTVQHQSGNPFASVAADQAIEQTVNRDVKRSGGLKGITLSKGE